MEEKILGWRPKGWEVAVVATVQQFETNDRVRATEFKELARGLIEGGASIMAMLITGEIEKMENPYCSFPGSFEDEHEGFECCRQKILSLFKEV